MPLGFFDFVLDWGRLFRFFLWIVELLFPLLLVIVLLVVLAMVLAGKRLSVVLSIAFAIAVEGFELVFILVGDAAMIIAPSFSLSLLPLRIDSSSTKNSSMSKSNSS